MSWIVLASIPPLLWAFSNHIDEYLSKHHFTTSPFLMIVAASVVQMVPGVLILYFYPQSFDLPLKMISLLCLLGVFSILCFVPYIKAIQIDGASVAVPIYQVIPVLTFIMAWVVLGETVGVLKIIAAFFIVSAAIGITWDFGKKSLSYKTLYLMLISSFGLALYNVASRYLLHDIDWLTMLAWAFIGTGVFGILAVILHKGWRRDLHKIISGGGWHVSILFIAQAGLDAMAFGLFISAMAIAPAAGLVSTLNGLQPFYVLVVAAFVGYFLPQKFQKLIIGKTLMWRIFCIIILFIGVAVLALSD